jgi:hypothetical protein
LLGGFLICKERTTISTLIAIVISIIGVVMVGWGDFGLNRQSVIIGDIFKCFGNCLLFINRTKYGKADFSLDLQFFCSYFNDLNLFANVPISGYDSKEWGIFFVAGNSPYNRPCNI